MNKQTPSEYLSLSGLRDATMEITLGAWTVKTVQHCDLDWNYYSKSWHRSHGPKVEIYGRKITFSRKHGRGTLERSFELKSWAGDFVANAVKALDLGPKSPKLPLKIRLNAAYDAKMIDKKRGYKIYSRTLLGEHVDYVIQSPLGMIYHDADRSNLVKGLHKKIRSQSRKLNGLIDWAMCKKLGFCDSGIKSFCDEFGFSAKGKYMPQDIESAVRKNPEAASPFMAELKTLAAALNYRYSI